MTNVISPGSFVLIRQSDRDRLIAGWYSTSLIHTGTLGCILGSEKGRKKGRGEVRGRKEERKKEKREGERKKESKEKRWGR